MPDPIAEARGPGKEHASALRERLYGLRKTFRETYLQKPGLEAVHEFSDGVSALLHEHLDVMAAQSGAGSMAKDMALVALGGFGRRELSHYSDIDFMFLTERPPTEEEEEFIKSVLYPLWDLKLDLGYHVASIRDCIDAVGDDLSRTTALLGSLHIWGDEGLTEELRDRLHGKLQKRHALWFVKSLQAEMEERHGRFGDTPLLLEPELKNTAGCLRDIHEVLWLAFASYGELNLEVLVANNLISTGEKKRLMDAWAFLLRLRNALHLLQNRRADKLTLERQIRVSDILGFRKSAYALAEEHLMRAFYGHASHVERLAKRLIEKVLTRTPGTEEHRLDQEPRRPLDRDFWWKGRKIWIEERDVPHVRNDPSWPLRLFLAACREKLNPTDGTLRRVEEHLNLATQEFRSSPLARDLFLSILKTPGHLAPTLRAMNRCGYLTALFPEFAAVRNLPKIDHYHKYTVDEHLIRTIAFGERLMEDPIPAGMRNVAEEARKTLRLDLLNMSLLFHDIGKGEGRGHVIRGMHTMQRIAERMGFRPVEREILRLLVANHQKMSHIALRRDPEDPATAGELAQAVGNPELLRMLYVHTACDLGGVSADSWNDWRGHLLTMLYMRTLAALRGRDMEAGIRHEGAVPFHELVWQEGQKQLGLDGAPGRKELEDFLTDLPDRYHRSVTAGDALGHYLLSSGLTQENPIRYKVDTHDGGNYVEITFVAHDAPNLFSNLCGALASKRLDILSAQIYTAYSGEAIDIFQVEVPEQLRGQLEGLLDRLCGQMLRVLRSGESIDWMKSIENTEYVPLTQDRLELRPPRIDINNDLSPTHTVIEVRAPDRPGLLSDIARVFDRNSMNVELAFIATESYLVVDVFYVTDLETNKIHEPAKLKRLQDDLLEAIHAGMTVREL